MRLTEPHEKPLARARELIVREVRDEVLIYDLTCEKAHCLNSTAALVWRNCDGRKTVAELTAIVARATDAPADERLVWLALEQLARDQLLDAAPTQPVRARSMSRRRMMRALAIGAGVAIPLVTSIVAPTPAQANYGLPSGACCNNSVDCQSNMCMGGSEGCPPEISGGRCA